MKMTIVIFLFATSAFAESKISLKIQDLTNIARGESMEVCGEAKHSEGIKPLLITVTHDESNYTMLTNKDGKWCTVIRRWTNSGNVTAKASTLDFSETSDMTVK